jgi:Protein of unknown function (DUF1579)
MNDSTNDTASGLAAAKIGQLREPGPEYRPLEILIGRWMTVGETVAAADAPASKIYASDVYEWVPGRFFIAHTAYGTIGSLGVGGIEMIGYDSNKKQFQTHFFDSHGNVTTEELTIDGDTIRWKGAQVRCNGTVQDNGRKLVCRHERLEADGNWVASMDVTLTRVD